MSAIDQALRTTYRFCVSLSLQLLKQISSVLDVPEFAITAGQPLSDFPWVTWEKMLELFVELEDEYDAALDCEVIASLETLGDLQAFLNQAIDTQTVHVATNGHPGVVVGQ